MVSDYFKEEKFLVADDDPQTCMILEKAFLKAGAETRFASNGLDALKILKSDYSITLAIVDIRMPKLDGYELVEKAIKIRPDVLYLAYTADVFRLDKERCKKIGFHSCLLKPLLPSMLIKLIREALVAKKTQNSLKNI